MLEKLAKEIDKEKWYDSQVVKCAHAFILHDLGTNFYDSEEISASEKFM